MAQAFVAAGFRADGRQIRPVSLSYLATAAGRSQVSAKRFMRRARDLGLLHRRQGEEVVFREGMKATPMHDLVIADREYVPAAMAEEVAALVATYPDDATWPPLPPPVVGSPPAWATAEVTHNNNYSLSDLNEVA